MSRLVEFEQTTESFDEENEQYVQSITSLAAPVAIKLIEIKEASIADAEIKAVEKALYNGTWSEVAGQFKAFETELCFVDNILLRGNKGTPRHYKDETAVTDKSVVAKNRCTRRIVCKQMPRMCDGVSTTST